MKGQPIDFPFHYLSEENGLSRADKYYLSKDSRGLAWFGSDDGLLSFDGRNIKKYLSNPDEAKSLFENRITSKCFEDRLGNLWFTSFNAVHCYLQKTDDFLHFSLQGGIDNYRGFYFKENELWLGIGSGSNRSWYIFDTQTQRFEQQQALPGEQNLVAEDKDGKALLLISTALDNRAGMVCLDLVNMQTKKIDFLFSSDGKPFNFANPTKASFVDQEGSIWVGIYNGIGRYTFKQNEGIGENQRSPEVDADIGWVRAITAYNENQLLVAADNGLFVFDKRNNLFTHQFHSNASNPYALKIKNLNNLLLDSTGTLWLSNTLQEIAFAQVNKNKFPVLAEVQGLFINNITEDQHKNIWVSSVDSGTYVFNQNKALVFQSKVINNPSDRAGYFDLPEIDFFIKNKKEEWWGNLANYYFIWRPDKKQFEINPSYFFGVGSTQSDKINYNYQLSNGTNLIAKGSAIYELKLAEQAADTLPWHNLNFLHLQTINIIYQDQNKHIYIGDNEGRLLILQEQNKQILKLAELKDVGIITALKQDPKRNTVWLTSSKGLGRIDPKTFEFYFLNEFKDQIPKEAYHNIALDESDQLWLPGNNGLIRYHPETKAFHRFGTADGLLANVYNKYACVRASTTGEIWLGGKNGLNVFKPEEVTLLNSKPNIHLSGLLVNDEVYETDGNLNEQEKLVFNYEQNTLSFEFVALDYGDPKSNEFRCQMLGYDKEVIELGTRNFIRYGNLPAGSYTFRIWGSNSDRVFNESPFDLEIKIIPPFYQTWWFYLLCSLALIGIVYVAFKYRLEQALKVERLRVKISSDLHDDVGGLLSGLAMQTELLELTADEKSKAKLKRIGELSRSAMSRMRDTVWAIDARKDKLENLLDRMNEHAEETLTPKNFSYTVKVENLNLSTNIPTDIRQNLYLIFKEAVTNTAKHSNGNHLNAILKKSEGDFVMQIKDNGKVIAKNHKTTGLGSSNIKMRAKQIDAQIVTSVQDGYEITLRRKSF